MADDERVAVIDLADELQVYKQTVFKIVRRLGLRHEQRRDPERGNQLVATLAQHEAVLIRSEVLRASAGPDLPASLDAAMTLGSEDAGYFYLIELEPEHDPERFKVGFTIELDGRLRKHRCSAPFARYVKTWSCRRTWERAAIDCATHDCERLHTEVFRAASVDAVIVRAEQFFAMMPSVAPAADGDDADLGGEDVEDAPGGAGRT